MMWALTSGMMGSSSPASSRVGCRMQGSNGRLVQPAPAANWYREPAGGRARGTPGARLAGDAAGGPDRAAAVQERCGPAGVAPEGPAVEVGGDPLGVAGVQVA